MSRVLPVPGLAEHALGFKTLADGDRPAQPRAAQPRDRRVAARRREPARVPDLRVHRRRLRRASRASRSSRTTWTTRSTAIRAAGSRARAGSSSDMLDRIMPEIPPSLAEFASRELRARGIELRTGTRLERMDEHSAVLSTGEVCPRARVCWTAGVKPPAIVRQLGAAAHPERSHRRGRHDAREGPGQRLGDRRRRGRARSRQGAQGADARRRRSTRSGRAAWWATTWQPLSPAGSHGRSATGRSACSWTWGSTRRSRRCSGCACAASPPGSRRAPTTCAMMPGVARRVRLAADWTVGLLFGRASAELGQLGHPPSLEHYLDERAAGRRGTRAVTELSFREGRTSDLQTVFELGEGGLGRLAPGPRAAARTSAARTRSCVRTGSASAR